jgi:hypothetical protein
MKPLAARCMKHSLGNYPEASAHADHLTMGSRGHRRLSDNVYGVFRPTADLVILSVLVESQGRVA